MNLEIFIKIFPNFFRAQKFFKDLFGHQEFYKNFFELRNISAVILKFLTFS